MSEERRVFKIPVGKIKYREHWWQFWRPKNTHLEDAIKMYKKKVEFNEDSGEIIIEDIDYHLKKDIFIPLPEYNNDENNIE